MVIEQTFFKAKRRIAYIDTIKEKYPDVQIVVYVMSPDDDLRYFAKIYASVDQIFKSIDDNVSLVFTVMIQDGFSKDIITIKIPPISMGKTITEYRDINRQIVAPIQEVLIKTAECMIKLSNVA